MAAIVVMVASFAAPALADEPPNSREDPGGSATGGPVVRDHRDDPSSGTGPVVRDHRDDDSSGSSGSGTVEEEPVKDPGIRQCDITPPYCQDTGDPKEPASDDEEEPLKDLGMRQCDIMPVECPNTDDPATKGEEEEPIKDPGIRQCDIMPFECPDTPDSTHKPAGPSDEEAGNTPDSGTIYDVCSYDDYYYDQETDMCVPKGTFLGSIFGEQPWPDSVGGHIGLLGDVPEDLLTGLGLGLELGLSHYLGDALIEFGEDGGSIGWTIQGAGYALGFAGEAGGALTVGIGEAIGAVADTVGDVVDGIGDAIGSLF